MDALGHAAADTRVVMVEVLTAYPPHETPILSWYGGAYDVAAFALHPFYTVPGLDPRDCAGWIDRFERSDFPAGLRGADLLAAGDALAARRRRGKMDPEQVAILAKHTARPIPWASIRDGAGFARTSDLNRALRTSIGALRAEFADEDGAARLRAYCARHRIFLPEEGRFETLMEASIASLFAQAGLDSVEAAGEFDDAGTVLPIAALAGPEPWTCEGTGFASFPRRLYARDRSLLVVVDWDSFFTLVCGTRDRMTRVALDELFEIRRCGPSSRHDDLD